VLGWLGVCAGGGQTTLLTDEIDGGCAPLAEITLDAMDEALRDARWI